jgi:hypothetical protein
MKDPKDDYLKGLKEETDQVLFKDLDFHHELKEKVRLQTRNLPPKKFGRKKSFFPIATIAAVLLLAIVSTTMFLNNDTTNVQMNTLVGEQENSNTESALKSFEVDTIENIKTFFSEEVQIPTYISTSYKLESIYASGMSQEEINQVVITYQREGQYYSVIIENSISELEPQGFQHVDINGEKGFIKTEETNDFLNTEVIWDRNGFHYVVNGFLSTEEAIKVAKSFQ